MSGAATTISAKEWPLSDSPRMDLTAHVTITGPARRSPISVERLGDSSRSTFDFDCLLSFINRYPRAWHVIKQVLGPDEALRLSQLCRDEVLTSLRVNHRWSLQAIGDLFDLSRERVRQVTPSIDGHGVTPDLDGERPPTAREVKMKLKEAFREGVRTREAWNGRGQVSKSWVVDYLGYEPDLPELDFRRIGESKGEFILRYGLGLETREEMRSWFEKMYFERGMTYAEIAHWLSQRFVDVAPMTIHRTATSILGVEGYGRGERTDR